MNNFANQNLVVCFVHCFLAQKIRVIPCQVCLNRCVKFSKWLMLNLTQCVEPQRLAFIQMLM